MRVYKILSLIFAPILLLSLASCANVSSLAGQTVFATVIGIDGQSVTARILPEEDYYPPGYSKSPDEDPNSMLDDDDDAAELPFDLDDLLELEDGDDNLSERLDRSLDLPWSWREPESSTQRDGQPYSQKYLYDYSTPSQASVSSNGIIQLFPGITADETVTFQVTPTSLKWLDVGDLLVIKFNDSGNIESIAFADAGSSASCGSNCTNTQKDDSSAKDIEKEKSGQQPDSDASIDPDANAQGLVPEDSNPSGNTSKETPQIDGPKSGGWEHHGFESGNASDSRSGGPAQSVE